MASPELLEEWERPEMMLVFKNWEDSDENGRISQIC
jgi:hypothetical protein